MDVAASVTYFDPQPADLPGRLPSPFGAPHPLAARAAEQLQRELAAGLAARLGLARDGKMFGVLVVADRGGRIGFLRGFSGMVDGDWIVPGFVGPTFDRPARDGFWIDGERTLISLADGIAVFDAAIASCRAQLDALDAAHAAELAALKTRHRAAKEQRHIVRSQTTDPEVLGRLNGESARESSERKALESRQRTARESARDPRGRDALEPVRDPRGAPLPVLLRELKASRDALEHERAAMSRDLLVRIHHTYALANARGEIWPLRDLFAPAEPPGGAGDCAAPKLLAHAYREQLRPLALAEFWAGAPPATGDRRDGTFYPACRGKCGPILAHMLVGLDTEPAPAFGEDAVDPAAPQTLFEDRWLAVISKPVGLLSVPGRSSKADSVLARLRVRYPDATGPLLPHRLDLDTSGLMLVAKDQDTHGALQRQFSERSIAKRYVALLDGDVVGEGGIIDLPLRVDLDDRPRQIVDAVHGKPAVTEWQVLTREGGRTRVAFSPKTGRAHQLRVHAAQGIGVPIVGDRLYGRPGVRLMLHAEAIRFVHPSTMEQLLFEQSAPF